MFPPTAPFPFFSTKQIKTSQNPHPTNHPQQCATGSNQSPIDILPSSVKTVSGNAGPKITWPSVRSAEFENLGTTVEVLFNGTLTYSGKTYSLKQFHFHTPGEHRVNEEYSPIEMHLVHAAAGKQFPAHPFILSAHLPPFSPSPMKPSTFHPPSQPPWLNPPPHTDKSILVVAQLFELSASDTTPLLQHLFGNHLSAISTPGSITTTNSINLSQIKQNLLDGGLYTYEGSLTTPPCTESVQWLISRENLPIDVESFNKLKAVVKFNSRYTQNSLGGKNLLEVEEDDLVAGGFH